MPRLYRGIAKFCVLVWNSPRFAYSSHQPCNSYCNYISCFRLRIHAFMD